MYLNSYCFGEKKKDSYIMTPSVWKIAVTEKDHVSYFQLLCFDIYHFFLKNLPLIWKCKHTL